MAPFGQSRKFSKPRWQYATIFSVYLYRKLPDFPEPELAVGCQFRSFPGVPASWSALRTNSPRISAAWIMVARSCFGLTKDVPRAEELTQVKVKLAKLTAVVARGNCQHTVTCRRM